MTGVQHKVVGTGFGIAGAYVVSKGLGDPYGLLVLPASMVGCMLPDIDHDMTKIGRKRKVVTNLTTNIMNFLILGGALVAAVLALITILGFRNYGFSGIELGGVAIGFIAVGVMRKFVTNSKTFKWATKHRGIMHTLVVPVLLFFTMRISDFPLWKYTTMGLLIGYCSHLFADMLTVEGCPVLFPLTKNNIRFMTLKTKNKSCTYAAWIVAAIAVAVGFVIGGGIL
jgi:membrane-bound metal-dependent hydrolase YbcI (DUF457 family)